MIRLYKKSDKFGLQSLFREFDEENKNLISNRVYQYYRYKDTEEAYEIFINDMVKNYFCVVCQEENKIIGYCSVKFSDKPEYLMDKEAYIDDWFVSKEFRGKGVGTKLLEFAVSEAKSRKCTHLKLNVFASNGKSIDYYHKIGFIDDSIEMYLSL